MTNEPRTQEEVYNSMRASLSGKIAKLRNFTERSFNYIWTQAFSREVQQLEAKTVVAELAGWIDYTGKELTKSDLEELNIDGLVEPEQLNEYMKDEYLDEYVKIVGISRLEGSRATGRVTIRTQSQNTTIPEGTVFTTEFDENGEAVEFETTEQVETADGVTVIQDVQIQALEIGKEHNVPAGTIVRMADPPIGVKSVNNPESTTGGEVEESNEELRKRAKEAVRTSSLGGTTDGISGYIRQNIESVGEGDVIIDESTDTKPPFVDVVVDGGTDFNIKEAIEFSRPTGVRHNLVRPEVIQLGWDINVLGESVKEKSSETNIENYLLDLGINENFYQDDFIRSIMESDDDIINISRLGGYIQRVTNEEFKYESGKSEYMLDYTYENSNGSVTVTDESDFVYTQGVDYEIQDKNDDGYPETLVWIGDDPSDGERFSVDYDVTVPEETALKDYYDTNTVRGEEFIWNEDYQESFDYNTTIDLYKLDFVPFDGSSIADNSGDSYTEGTDYEIIDDSGNGFEQTIDWSISGGTPNNGEEFTITYDKKVYHTDKRITDTEISPITDIDGDSYTNGSDYELVDYQGDEFKDAIEWLTNPSTISDGDEFYLSYFTTNDIFIEKREKIDPGTIDVTQV